MKIYTKKGQNDDNIGVKRFLDGILLTRLWADEVEVLQAITSLQNNKAPQTEFVKNRHGSENVRRLLHTVDTA